MSITYPLNNEVNYVDRVARWRPLFNWLLTVPLLVWLQVLELGAGPVALVGWFAIVFSGRLPESLGNYQVAVLRYRWRVYAFLFGLTDRYPGFAVAAGYVDPGEYPAVLYSARPVQRRRASVLFRAILIVPQLIVLWIVSLVAAGVLVIGWFTVLVIGRWPEALLGFVVDWMRWSFRVQGYFYLIVDDYPPFGFQP